MELSAKGFLIYWNNSYFNENVKFNPLNFHVAGTAPPVVRHLNQYNLHPVSNIKKHQMSVLFHLCRVSQYM